MTLRDVLLRTVAMAMLAVFGHEAHAEEPRRTIFLPAAATTGAGKFDVTLYELGFPSVSYGVTDRLQIGVAGTFIPTAETIVVPGAKFQIAHAEGIRLSAVGALAIDTPNRGRTGWMPMAGLAGTRCGAADRFCGSVVLLSATPTSVRGTDRVTDIAVSASWTAGRHVDLLAEQHVRTTVPDTQVGATTVVAARLHSGFFSVDAGWLLDVGIVGAPFPLVGPDGVLGVPGVPVLNVAFALP